MKKFFIIAGTVITLATGMTYNIANAGDNGPTSGTVGAVAGAASADGARAAEASARIYNGINPEHPMPVLHGDDAIIRDTLKNIGAGMHPGPALDKAIKDETKIPEAKPAQASAPAPAAKPTPAPAPEHNDRNGRGEGRMEIHIEKGTPAGPDRGTHTNIA